MIVAFVGSNGTGKTTLCTMLARRLRRKGLRVIVRTEFEHLILKYLISLYRYLSKMTGTTDIRRIVLGSQHSKAYTISLFPMWMDDLITYFYVKWRKKDIIVLTDRYAYDIYVPLMMMGVNEHFFRTLFLVFPKPDILIFLDVSAKTVVERKPCLRDFDPTFNLDFFEKGVKCYRQFAKMLGVEMVNSELPIDSILDMVEKSVIGQIHENNNGICLQALKLNSAQIELINC